MPVPTPSQTPMGSLTFGLGSYDIWFHYQGDPTVPTSGVWQKVVQFDPSYSDEINFLINPCEDPDSINCAFGPSAALNESAQAILNSFMGTRGNCTAEPFQVAALARALFAGDTDWYGLGQANELVVTHSNGGTNCATESSSDAGCPTGYYYDAPSESCLPLCGSVYGVPACFPIPPVNPTSCNLTCKPPAFLNQTLCLCVDPPVPSRNPMRFQ